MRTRWGASQHRHKITQGVYEVDTAGHGGIMVRKEVAQQLLSKEALNVSDTWEGWICFEEDCDWALFVYEQPVLYAACRAKQGRKETAEEWKQLARKTLEHWYPKYLAAVEDLKENTPCQN